MHPPRPFLRARWVDVASFSWLVDPSLVHDLAPGEAELDLFERHAVVSLVAFSFLDTAVLGIPVPFHQRFPEMNLRLAVRIGEARGVTFIRELVPRALIVAGARAIFREPYARRTMTCGTTVGPDETRHVWHRVQGAGGLDVWAEGGARAPSDTSADRWLTHHDLGLGRGWRRARTHIYRVEHPCWPCHPVTRWSLDLDLERLYGRRLQSVVSGEPWRVVLAAGSRVSVSPPMTPGTVGNLDGARSLTAGRALLLYDEDCGICTHTVRMINRYDRDGQVRPVGIRSKAGARALADLTPAERLQTWHLIEADGTRLSGGAALPALCRRLPGLQLTERLLRRFPTAADTFYAAIAARRHGLSSLLGLNACSVEERTP